VRIGTKVKRSISFGLLIPVSFEETHHRYIPSRKYGRYTLIASEEIPFRFERPAR
jgi:hypothetical protein